MNITALTLGGFVGRYENTFSALGIALLHTVFYRSGTVERLTDILTGLLLAGKGLDFIKERYSPTVREAILQKDVYISPLSRLQLLLQFTGTMVKMVRYKTAAFRKLPSC